MQVPLMVRAKWSNHKPGWLAWRLGFVNAGYRSRHAVSDREEFVRHVNAFDGKLVASHSFSTRPRRTQVSSAALRDATDAPSQQHKHQAIAHKAPLERQARIVSALLALVCSLYCCTNEPCIGYRVMSGINCRW
jgi:hypothetical protein